MARLINKHFGMIVSVEPTEKSKDDESWIWRKDYEGFIGVISIYESQCMAKGQHFIVMNNDTRYIKTGTGTLTFINTNYPYEAFIILSPYPTLIIFRFFGWLYGNYHTEILVN